MVVFTRYVFALCIVLVTSPFGAVLAGIRENEAKKRARFNTRY
jgi:ABC-type branched-subunit amino acid transport system permease subunit